MSKKNSGGLIRKRAVAFEESGTMPVNVCWYTKESWGAVRAFAADPEKFEESFYEWEVMANKAFENFRSLGMDVRKFHVDPESLQSWCKNEGRANEAASRAQFASVAGQSNLIPSGAAGANGQQTPN